MTVRRMSISVPPEIEELIKEAAEAAEEPVSTWLADAAKEKAQRQAKLADGRRAIREYEADLGPIPEEYRREARRFLAEHGLVDETRAVC